LVCLMCFWWSKQNIWCINFNMQAWWKKCQQWCEWKDIVFITKTTFELKVFKCIIKWIKPISFFKKLLIFIFFQIWEWIVQIWLKNWCLKIKIKYSTLENLKTLSINFEH
jgi:hypothetical protein